MRIDCESSRRGEKLRVIVREIEPSGNIDIIGKPVRVIETRCCANGDPFDEFEVYVEDVLR